MKKQITSSLLKQILTSAIVVTVLFIGEAKAAGLHAVKPAAYDLTYIGTVQSQPVFQLNVENPREESLFINLEDEAGNVLYSEKFEAKNFSKKFQFDTNEGLNSRIKVVVRSKHFYDVQTFEISNVERSVASVVVTKVTKTQ